MGYYNRRDLAVRLETEAIQREMAKHGHDSQAAARLGRLVSFESAIAGLLATNPAALHNEIEQAAERQIAELRAEGPVGCECGHWRCVESRPTVSPSSA